MFDTPSSTLATLTLATAVLAIIVSMVGVILPRLTAQEAREEEIVNAHRRDLEHEVHERRASEQAAIARMDRMQGELEECRAACRACEARELAAQRAHQQEMFHLYQRIEGLERK